MILRRLRKRVDARPILREHLHRRRGGGAEIIIGAGEGDVELGLIATRAEIDVDTPQRRRRVIAPTGIVDGVGRDIARQVSDLRRPPAPTSQCAHTSRRSLRLRRRGK